MTQTLYVDYLPYQLVHENAINRILLLVLWFTANLLLEFRCNWDEIDQRAFEYDTFIGPADTERELSRDRKLGNSVSGLTWLTVVFCRW